MKPFLLLFFVAQILQAQVQKQRTVTLMGSRFDITIIDKNDTQANSAIDMAIAEIDRIENLISEWRPQTQVSEVNRMAGIKPVKVDRELLRLTQSALKFSVITGGAFDISIAAMDKIWKFDGSITSMPSPEVIKKSIQNVNYLNIELDTLASTIFLKKVGMKIGFGSIGKGYAADKARALLEEKGIPSGIINASGDLTTWGSKQQGTPWSIGITNPFRKNHFVSVLSMCRYAATTSGTYEKYFMLNHKRYAHIINPKTGYPSTGICSATVFGPSAEMANGYSTSIMVLGVKKGLQLIRENPQYSCVLILDTGRVIYSNNFNKNKHQALNCYHKESFNP